MVYRFAIVMWCGKGFTGGREGNGEGILTAKVAKYAKAEANCRPLISRMSADF
jgi:hypothetical protein